ncbi:MAG TPA: DUF4244 domain-containing protein [Propionibacteriaceae bacterium]|nr:DUF4244 domain-containing protein [Propionibacteriaceae bacterium]
MSELATTSPVSRRQSLRKRVERGAVSAEYALLTVGTITFGGILVKILSDPEVRDQIARIIDAVMKLILSHFGLM